MRWNAYPRIKPSDTPWLGYIPSHWSIVRLKTVADFVMGQSPSSESCNTDEIGMPFLQGCSEFTAQHPVPRQYCEEPPKSCAPGDVLFSVRAPVGEMNIADQSYGIGRGICALRSESLGPYLWWSLIVAKPQLDSVATGSTYEAVSAEDVRNAHIPLPPAGERNVIAVFLSRETAKIDALIAEQRNLISLLRENNHSVVVHAVTKGLNREIKLTESGVKQLGQVPTHWSVNPLGKKIQLQRGVDITKSQQSEGPIPVVSSGGVSSYHNVPICKGPGVVVGRKGTAGKLHWVETDYWPHDTTLYVKDFGENEPRFVYYTLWAMDLESFDTGTANPTLNRNVIHPVPRPWPPVDEQRIIAAELDNRLQAAQRLIIEAETSIALLLEHRSALITAVVTGKVDVREAMKEPA